jgi:hypothetical protein
MSERGDEVDRANAKAESMTDAALAEIRYQAGRMPAGEPGDCELCGEWSGRLVLGVCAPCRDKWGRP